MAKVAQFLVPRYFSMISRVRTSVALGTITVVELASAKLRARSLLGPVNWKNSGVMIADELKDVCATVCIPTVTALCTAPPGEFPLDPINNVLSVWVLI